MRTASYFLLASALLHVVGSLLIGLDGIGLFLLFPAGLYLVFCLGLLKGFVWVAWLVLVCMVGGMAGTVLELVNRSMIPEWILWGILAADLAVAITLARVLWGRLRG